MNYCFKSELFQLFELPTLDARMQVIREEVQPIFRYLGENLAKQIQQATEQTLVPVHVAKHLRRTVYPPTSTWVAIGGDKRGYKKYPHFQIGMNAEYVFIMLALIDNPLHERAIAQLWQTKPESFEQLPDDYCVIPDHTALGYITQAEADYATLLQRFETVKKAEFMLGRIAPKGSAILEDEEMLMKWLKETVQTLLPFYTEAWQFYEKEEVK